jgi:hypothetical protein
METKEPLPPVSKAAWWTGAILSALPMPLLLMGIVIIFVMPDVIKKDMVEKYGYPASAPMGIILAEFVSAVLYIIPQTAVLGAILLTGYLGGAVDTHVHAGEWTKVPMPILFAVVLWLGLYLRDPRLRALVPWRRIK